MKPQVFQLPRTAGGSLLQHHTAVLVDHLRKGRIAVLPTETGPMLACDALNISAVEHLFTVKGRPGDNPVHVAIPFVDAADNLIELNPVARRLLEFFAPGPITVVCPKKEIVPNILVAQTGNLGVRIVDDPLTQLICALLGSPITATSLNLSGEKMLDSVYDTIMQLNWHNAEIVYVIEGVEEKRYSTPSTVVRFEPGFGREFTILRQGPIKQSDLLDARDRLSFEDMQDWG